MTDIRGKRTLVTGAAHGLGRLLAIELARAGARPVLWDIDEQGLRRVEEELAGLDVPVETHVCDLASADAIDVAARRTLAAGGPIEILVNNAGIVAGKPLLELADEEIERTFAVNTLAPFRTVRAFLPAMLERDSGHIVTIASAAGIAATARLTDYCASKFAAVGFDEALRLELRGLGSRVRTTVVCPYLTDTGMFDGATTRFAWLLPILEPADVVRRTLRAIRRNRRRVVMPWFVYTAWPMRLLPVAAFDWLMKFFGVTESMNSLQVRPGTRPG